MLAFPKFRYIRCEAIKLACRTIPCQHCGADDGTVVWAHSNWQCHGHGRGIKASDIYVGAMCHKCHSLLDQGSKLSRDERKAMWWAAHVKTVLLLQRLGRWPADVPVPDLTTPP